ncbi:hypothetical protein B0T20DRAFT_48761 [Sordaria brevicollis]|uniref:Uncharacterized protein n=1 Tax=Sordaria brevicollis TaxID=83679 RepID=A0AAE0P9Q7_SORBR|nr:hypothetical protein B0T20DRAFT_48761 [Sordaria brevicollis]
MGGGGDEKEGREKPEDWIWQPEPESQAVPSDVPFLAARSVPVAKSEGACSGGLNGWPDKTGDWTGHCGSYPRVQGGVSSAGLPGDSLETLGLWNLAGVRYGSPCCRTGAVVNRMTNNGQQDCTSIGRPALLQAECMCMFPCPRIRRFVKSFLLLLLLLLLLLVDVLLMLCVSVYTRVAVTPHGDGLVMVGSLALLVRASTGQSNATLFFWLAAGVRRGTK